MTALPIDFTARELAERLRGLIDVRSDRGIAEILAAFESIATQARQEGIEAAIVKVDAIGGYAADSIVDALRVLASEESP